MDTPAPMSRRRRSRRAGLRIRIAAAFVALGITALAVSSFVVSELGLQAERDHEVWQAALAAHGDTVEGLERSGESRAEHLELKVVGQSDPREVSPAVRRVRDDAGSSTADSVAAHAAAESVQRAQAANRLMWILLPTGVVVGTALALALAREVVSAARAALARA